MKRKADIQGNRTISRNNSRKVFWELGEKYFLEVAKVVVTPRTL
jgi:hypothetical protein